jgi:hypothetical protein
MKLCSISGSILKCPEKTGNVRKCPEKSGKKSDFIFL